MRSKAGLEDPHDRRQPLETTRRLQHALLSGLDTIEAGVRHSALDPNLNAAVEGAAIFGVIAADGRQRTVGLRCHPRERT
jgi:hypothetical protein